MSRLLRDRYYADAAGRGWDLATGENVPLNDPPDDEVVRQPALASLVEVLDHGREGCPRWVVLDRPPGARSAHVIRRAAEDARSRGFVPVAVDLYLRLGHLLVAELHDRTLLLIARPGLSQDLARSALLDAAARAPRPHVLLTFAREAGGSAPVPAARADMVREARAAYATQAVRPRLPASLPEDVMRQVLRGSRAGEFAREGRHAAAERLLRDVAAALVRRRAPAAASQTLVSLGRLLVERGRAQDADEVFGEAAIQGDAAQDEALTADARIWQAAARTDAGRLTAAEAVCRAVLLSTTLHAADRARAEAALARVLLWQGRRDEAAELPIVATACEDASFAYIGATAVRVLLEGGRGFEAGQRARQILTAVEASTDSLTRVIALTAHVRVLIAAGDLALAEERLRELRRLADDARATLRCARVRLLWADALRRAGRDREAKREAGYLQRIRAVAPPLLQSAIDRHLRHDGAPVRTTAARPSIASGATALIALAQREGDDRAAVLRLFEYTAGALRCSRIDLCCADAGVVTVTTSVGAGLPTRLGSRVLEAGIAIGPEDGDPGREIGVPVRLGPRLLAAIVVRWPADAAPPPHTQDLMDVMTAVASPRVEALLSAAREESQAASAIPELVGGSAAIADLRKAVARTASAPFAVLIEGESGVGKELVARAIHHLSPRRQRRFCDVNCAALPDELIESELFGHARGAFTGAVAERAGLVEDADGGTLFLDEVADLSPRAQAKLLRVIQQQEVRRVGESFSRKVDVRLVSAANRDMRAEAEAGRFRQDLLYRLEVIRIRIPALRERPEDVAVLARHIWRDAAARVGTSALLTHGVLTALARYHWPGNVRELQNVMAALAVAAPSRGPVRPALLPAAIAGAASVTSPRLADARAQFDRRFLEVALARAGGSRSRAAREMGISRQGLLKLMARVGLVST